MKWANWIDSLASSRKRWVSSRRRSRLQRANLRGYSGLEQLECRLLLTNYSAASVSALIADINAANTAGGANTITLTAPSTSPYVLTAADNITNGATGLPVIAAKDNLTIIGNADSIERSAATGTAGFRLFDVAAGATLTLENLTLAGGLSLGTGVSAEGGAIYNQGTLALSDVIVENNIAQGITDPTTGAGQNAEGGGIYSSGTLTLTAGTTIENNEALGGDSGARPKIEHGLGVKPAVGGNALGGGIYLAAGVTANLTNVTLSSNTAQGGNGSNFAFVSTTSFVVLTNAQAGGYGAGGAIYGASGAMVTKITLSDDTITSNIAKGGQGGNVTVLQPTDAHLGVDQIGGGGGGYGGGLDVSGTVSLIGDSLSSNSAEGGNGGNGYYDNLFDIGGAGGTGSGGALLISGTDTLTGDTLSSNTAQGGTGGESYDAGIGGGTGTALAGTGYGGGLDFTGGTLIVSGSTLSSNIAQAGAGSAPGSGNGFGGAIYVGGSTVTLNRDTLTSNVAQGGTGIGPNVLGEGGGVYIVAGATVDIGTSTVADIINNTASTSSPNIFGTYTKTK